MPFSGCPCPAGDLSTLSTSSARVGHRGADLVGPLPRVGTFSVTSSVSSSEGSPARWTRCSCAGITETGPRGRGRLELGRPTPGTVQSRRRAAAGPQPGASQPLTRGCRTSTATRRDLRLCSPMACHSLGCPGTRTLERLYAPPDRQRDPWLGTRPRPQAGVPALAGLRWGRLDGHLARFARRGRSPATSWPIRSPRRDARQRHRHPGRSPVGAAQRAQRVTLLDALASTDLRRPRRAHAGPRRRPRSTIVRVSAGFARLSTVLQEGLADLEHVDRQARLVHQRRVATADEVVDRGPAPRVRSRVASVSHAAAGG